MSQPDAMTTPIWMASIVVYHSKMEALMRTLEGVAAQQLPAQQVFVHFNDDAEGAAAAALQSAANERVAGLTLAISHSASNLGFAGAHNQLAATAFRDGAEAVLVLNPDLVLDPAAALELAHGSQGLALAGPVLELAHPETLDPQGLIDSAGIRWTRTARHFDHLQGRSLDELTQRTPYAVAGITGACLWVPCAVHDRIVGQTGELFDKDFLAYREDAELGLRCSRIGVHQVIVPAARGRHGRTLRGTQRGAADLGWLVVRNRYLIALKHGRHRPGAWTGAPARDLMVIAYVVLRERRSISALTSAWRLRHRMREKARWITAAERRSATAQR